MKIISLLFVILINQQCDLLRTEEENRECDAAHVEACKNVEGPPKGYMTVKVQLNDLNPFVYIEIFYSDIEHGHLAFTDTLYTEVKTYKLSNGRYSGRGIYKYRQDDQIIELHSIDGEQLSPTALSDCDGPCYEEGEITLELN